MEVAYRGRAVYVPAADALVVADLHAGRDAASSVALPLGEQGDLLERLGDHVAAVAPETVVFAGDLLHVHGGVPRGAGETVTALLDVVRANGAEPVVVRGNHDAMLDDVVAVDARVVDEYRLPDGTVVCHGHEEPDATAPRYVVGHEHPAIRVEGKRHPCFLFGERAFRGGDVLVVPAFSRLASGTVVNRVPDAMSPLVPDLGAFRPVVASGETFEFPPLGDFADLL